jgi:hypothetical protein
VNRRNQGRNPARAVFGNMPSGWRQVFTSGGEACTYAGQEVAKVNGRGTRGQREPPVAVIRRLEVESLEDRRRVLRHGSFDDDQLLGNGRIRPGYLLS